MYSNKKVQLTGRFLDFRELDNSYFLVLDYADSDEIIFRLSFDSSFKINELASLNCKDVTVRGYITKDQLETVVDVDHIWTNDSCESFTQRKHQVLFA
jgi:hypothetical protein